jgi:hypothetical protein
MAGTPPVEGMDQTSMMVESMLNNTQPVDGMAPTSMMAATRMLNTTPVPSTTSASPPPPPTEPSMGVSMYATEPVSDVFMPAYENEYAEIDDIKDPESN